MTKRSKKWKNKPTNARHTHIEDDDDNDSRDGESIERWLILNEAFRPL